MTDPKPPNEPDSARRAAELLAAFHHPGSELSGLAAEEIIAAVGAMIDERIAAAVGAVKRAHAEEGLRLHVEAEHVELDRRLIALEAATPTAAELEEIDRNARAYGFEVGRGRPLTAQISGLSDDNPFLNNPFLNKGWRDGVPAPTDQVSVAPIVRDAAADSRDCECERWRDGATVCPVHGDTKPAEVTDPGPWADLIATGGLAPSRNNRVLQVLAESLLDLAAQAMPPTYLATDARCRLARAVLDALAVS